MSFISHFLHFAKDITQSERGLAYDTQFSVVGHADIDDLVLKSAKFNDLAQQVIREAQDKNEAIITNNVIIDPTKAPTTNISFSDLRMVVAIPLVGVGVVYLDRLIKVGVIPREQIEKIKAFGDSLLSTPYETLSLDELKTQFEAF